MASKNAKLVPRCNDTAPCFARSGDFCTILSESYKNGRCPFRKASEKNITVSGIERSPNIVNVEIVNRDFWELFATHSEYLLYGGGRK